MASSSQNLFDGLDDQSFDDAFDQYVDQQFDQYLDQQFDQTFENITINYGHQEKAKKQKKRAYIERIVKKGIFVYGMIISVKLQRIPQICSGDDLE